MFIKKHRSEHGFSLLELLIVVTILGIAASVAIPDISTTNTTKLDLAAEEHAQAMRFARSEAIRTGQPHGFKQVSSKKRIRVFRADTSTSPWAKVYDVYHPISKKLYDIYLDQQAFAEADSLNRNVAYRGTCNTPRIIYFDNSGIPRCADPEIVLLERFTLTLTLGKHTRVVSLSSITGRVTVQ